MRRTNVLFIFFSAFIFVQCMSEETVEPINNSITAESLQKKGFPGNEYTKVFRTGHAMVINGVENDWENIPKHKLRNYFDLADGPTDNKLDLYSYFKMAWDDDNLYVLVNVLDDSISVNAPDDQPYNKDSFELFIDGDNSKNAPPDDNIPHGYPGSYDPNDEQMRFTWQEDAERLPWFYDNSSFEYAYNQTSKGWNVELKMPFASLVDFPGEAGHVFGIEFHINDNDGDGRQNFVKWNSESDFTYLYPSLFGTAYLFDAVAE